MRTTSLLTALLSSLALAGLLAGCSDSTAPGDGHIRINLIDATAPYDSVIIAVEQVEVHAADGDSNSGWTTVSTPPGNYDLLQLVNGSQVVIADHALAPGHYTQIRLILGAGSHVVVDGVSHPLVIPSGMQTGLKLNTPFDIVADQLYVFTLDFDAARSIRVVDHGVYQLSPVIRVVPQAIAGTIHGTVSPAAALPLVWTVAGPDTVRTNADPLSGEFRLMMLPAGTYTVHIAPTNVAFRDSVIAGVPVVAQQETELGTIVLRAAK